MRRSRRRASDDAGRSGSSARRVVLAAGIAAAAALIPFAPGAAQAATTATPTGHVDVVRQSASGVVTVSGWAYDRGRSELSDIVVIYIDTRAFVVRANLVRGDVNRHFGIHGRHGFSWTGRLPRVHGVSVWAHPISANEPSVRIALAYLNGYRPAPTAGQRIVAEASRHVGQAYVYGAAGPTAFDCSGLAAYVYRTAGVAVLPHSAEAQRETVHLIPASALRPGDLIFYLSGGVAYHVSIYIGGGRDIAAADPWEGVVDEPVWGSNLEYGTTWH